MSINAVLHRIAVGLELAGVAVIVLGAVFAVSVYLRDMIRGGPASDAYRRLRRNLGQAILLGLEFLVAGDIVGTVVIDPTFRSLGVLGLIVGIRTFLSFALEVEINGRWPWRGQEAARGDGGAPAT